MNRKLTRIAMEELELEIDKAIEKQQIEKSGGTDALLLQVEEEKTEKTTEEPAASTEDTLPADPMEEDKTSTSSAVLPITDDQIEANDASLAIESIFKLIEKGVTSCASLEKIAEIIGGAEETGGLDPIAADFTNTVVESICNDLDIPKIKISVEGFNSHATRQKVSLEAIENIKARVAQIWQMIISGLKAVIDFIKKAITAYKSDMTAQKAELEKLKEIYRNVTKVETAEPEIQNSLFQILLNNKSGGNTSAEVLSLGKNTLDIIDSYIVSFRRNVSTSVDSINNIGAELLEEGKEFNKDDVVKHGKIFGMHLPPVLNKVPVVEGFRKTSNTISCFETELMAGNMKLIAFTATDGNIQYQDIIDSKCLLAAVESQFDIDKMMVSEITDIKKLFELIEEGIRLSVRTYETADILERNIREILKTAEMLSKNFTKALDKDPENNRRKSQIYNNLSLALQSFYSKPIHSIVRFNNRYVKALNTYVGISLKSYM